MKRILSILLSAIMVIAILPVSVFMVAAEDTVLATFEFGANGATGHTDGSTMNAGATFDDSGYTLTVDSASKAYSGGKDATGKSALKFGTSSVVGSMSFTVPDEVTKVVINVAGYKATNAKISVNGGDTITISTKSNNGEYTAVEVDTSTTKTVTFATVSGGVRAMVDSIVWYGTPAEGACQHTNVVEGDCTTDTVCGDCGATLEAAPGHNYENGACTECGEEIPVMTIPEVLAAEVGAMVIVSGTVDSFYQEWNATYNNCSPYIVDEDGNQLLIYGIGTKVGVGDKITVTGAVSQYGGVNQIVGQGAEIVIDAQHTCEFSELTCTEDSVCIYCGALNEEAPGHNYENGTCTECGEVKPAFATLDFAEDGNRTSYSTTQQIWEANGIVFTNDKASSTTNIRNNLSDNHVRLYANSSVTIEYAGMTKIVFYCSSATYATALTSSITGGNVTTEDNVVTIVLDAATDSYTIEAMSAQIRVDSIDVYAEATETEPEYIRIDGYQMTNVVDGKYNVRFVAAISELVEGQSLFGFKITTTADGGKSWDKTTYTVYSSITANYGTDVVTAEEIGAAYVTAMAITGVPAELGTVTFVVTPYTVINGETVYGAAVEIEVTPTVAE